MLFLAGLLEPGRAEPGRHLFILSGQSNMRQPLPEAFEEVVAKVFGADKVLVVTHAHPSQPIRRWYKRWAPPQGMEADGQENGQLYDALMKKVNKAIEGRALDTVTFIWMQGEADAGSGWGPVYEESFLGLLDQFKSDLGRDEIPFVIGRINDSWLPERGTRDGELVRKMQVKLGEEHDEGAWIDTDDLNMGVNPWGIFSLADGHFPPAGYRVMGQRFAREACRLIDPQVRLAEGVLDAVFMDSPDQVAGHAAIGKQVSGFRPQGKGGASLAVLTDGKFGGAAPGDGDRVGCPPSTESAEWVVDLGLDQDVSAIAASIRVDSEVSAGFPVSLDFAVSTDGKAFRSMVNRRRATGVGFGYKDAVRQQWSRETEPRSVLVLVEGKGTRGRYLKVTAHTAESWLLLDEIMVNPLPNLKAAGAGG